MLFWCGNSVFAQTEAPSPSKAEKIVRKIRFSGNRHVKDRTLENLIRTRINREFFGIPQFTPWYYIWQLSGGRFGEDPVYLDREIIVSDMERIALYYNSLGFLNADVDTTIIEYRKNKMEVSFIINEGEPSIIRSVTYSGMPILESMGKRTGFFKASELTRKGITDTSFVVNRRYKSEELRTEQVRILDYLKNRGYASIERDSVIALVKPDEENPLQVDVLFRISPGSIYKFGDIHISLADPFQPDEYTQKDTLSGEPFAADTNKIYLLKEPAAQTKFSLLSDQILFKAGDLYNNDLYLKTVKEYQNLGMLYIRRFGLSETGTQADFTKEKIPVYFELQTITRHSIKTELFGMKRYGYGTGFGVDYVNNNVFGKGENLTIGANASLEFVSSKTLEKINPSSPQSTLFQSFELRGEYALPRLTFPFKSFDNTKYFTSAYSRYSLSYSTSDQLYFDINSDVRFNYRYEVNHNSRYSSFLDLLELDIVDTNPSDEFKQNLKNEFGENSIEYQRILEDFEPQISSIIRYTLRTQNTDLIKRDHGYYSEISIASGGNIPYLVDKYFVTPDTLEGNLPSLFKISDNILSYSRFLKLTTDYRRYYPISNSTVFAWRFFGGYAHPYGRSHSLPLNRRFFAGGSNDIRGWAPFQLGPGSIAPEDVTINGGEIKLSAFTELRQVVFRNVFGANWLSAMYLDAGNVWYGPRNDFSNLENNDLLEQGRFKFDQFYKQIAVGTGLGMRMEWDFVVIRLDFTFRAHDLDKDVGWFNNKKMYFSFGIGHSF